MAYRLSLTTDTAATLRDTAREQIEDAVRRLRGDGSDDPVKAVHKARKDLKKARSLLRIARPDMRRRIYRRENRALRDVGRSLSGARDADVLVETTEALAERFVGQLPETMFEAMGALLAREAEAARAAAGDGGDDAAAALDAVLARIGDWPLHRADRDTLVRGAARAYTRGRDALADADRDPSVENLHALRKRVKDLWYHARLLRDAWPVVLEAQSEAAHDLADVLGDDHDLAVLAERVGRGLDGHDGAVVDEDAVIELIARRRAELQADAMRIARRLYAEAPKAFRRRMGAYVELGAAEAPVAAAA